jgi:hypothetical protein
MEAGYNGFISFFAKQKTYSSKMAWPPGVWSFALRNPAKSKPLCGFDSRKG